MKHRNEVPFLIYGCVLVLVEQVAVKISLFGPKSSSLCYLTDFPNTRIAATTKKVNAWSNIQTFTFFYSGGGTELFSVTETEWIGLTFKISKKKVKIGIPTIKPQTPNKRSLISKITKV